MPQLIGQDIEILRETICRVQDYQREGVKTLKDIFSKDAHLIISPSNHCLGGLYGK
jgi:hypothetical protein